MPGAGATDPADIQAQACAELDLSRELDQTHHVKPSPSLGGGGYDYDVWYCQMQLTKAQNGEEVDMSCSSIRWINCLEPFHQTGYKAWETDVGLDLITLVSFLTAWPEGTIDEMAPFIYNKGGELYSVDGISRRLKDLGISTKRASTEAYQALRDDVQFHVYCFWNYGPPLGI